MTKGGFWGDVVAITLVALVALVTVTMAVGVKSYAADLNGVKRGRGLGVSESPQTMDKGGSMVDLIHGKISEQRGDFIDNGGKSHKYFGGASGFRSLGSVSLEPNRLNLSLWG